MSETNRPIGKQKGMITMDTWGKTGIQNDACWLRYFETDWLHMDGQTGKLVTTLVEVQNWINKQAVKEEWDMDKHWINNQNQSSCLWSKIKTVE